MEQFSDNCLVSRVILKYPVLTHNTDSSVFTVSM